MYGFEGEVKAKYPFNTNFPFKHLYASGNRLGYIEICTRSAFNSAITDAVKVTKSTITLC